MSTIKSLMLAGSAAFLLTAGMVGADAAPVGRDPRVAACDKFHRCVTRDGRYLEVNVRSRRNVSDDYDYSAGYAFEINDFERPTLRFGNNGFIGQNVYRGLGGYRTQLGNSSFDNLR